MLMLFPLSRICSSLVTRLPSGNISYSVTSSRTMLTKSSNPSRVPTISLSFFMIIWILDPMHLSINSRGSIDEADGRDDRDDTAGTDMVDTIRRRNGRFRENEKNLFEAGQSDLPSTLTHWSQVSACAAAATTCDLLLVGESRLKIRRN